MISSHLHRNFQFWSFFYLVTKTSTQLLFKNAGGCWGMTYIKWKPWISSFRKNCRKLWEVVRKAVVMLLNFWNVQSPARWQHIIQIYKFHFFFMILHKKVSKMLKRVFLLIKRICFMIQINEFLDHWLKPTWFFSF